MLVVKVHVSLPLILSIQGINRTLLSWLKLWDEVVFGQSAFSSKGGGKKVEEKRTAPGAAGSAGQGKMGKKDGGSNYRMEYRDPGAFAGPEVAN